MNAEQDRLNEAIIDVFREARDRGWINKEIDIHAGALFIQAYTFGIIINDVAGKKVEPEAWNELIDMFIEKNYCQLISNKSTCFVGAIAERFFL